MKLKYNILALALLGSMVTACDPMDEINKEVEAKSSVVKKSMDEYVLTATDYATISTAAAKDATTPEEKALANAVKTDLALNEFATAEKYVPAIVAALVPSWGEGSSVAVTYNYQNSPSEQVTKYSNVKNSSLSNALYASIWGDGSPIKFLTPAHAPETVIPAWLLEQNKSAAAGDMVLVDYKFDSNEPVFSGKEYVKQDFETVTASSPVELENWKNIAVAGPKQWAGKLLNGNKIIEISAYKSTEEIEAWLISPAIAIDSESAKVTFDLCFGYYKGDCFDFLVSDTYKGGDEIDATQWTNMNDKFTYPTPKTSGYTASVNVGGASLAAYKGKTVYFAFRYKGNADKTTTVQVDNFSVSSSVLSKTNEKPYNALYKFDGKAWVLNNDASLVVVTPEDYDAMGSATGQYDNFSNSAEPADYLPAFLAKKFSFAQEGEAKSVMYKYYNSSSKVTSIKVDQYIFKAGAWALNNNIETKAKVNFVCGTKGWMFDPTVSKSLGAADYVILENWVRANKPGYLDSKYGNSEYWFGGSSYYQNFNIQFAKRRSNDPDGVVPADDDAAKEYLLDKVVEGIKLILAEQYASAPAQMSGIDCYYNITVKIYDGLETLSYVYRFKGLGNADFELEGERTQVK